ncbi:MAG: MarR family transcriptional regulator [Blastocatellia bacterium]|nr:MarR family transcriptional regulator [Blastocatellia bacterium]MBN8722621.1 MarR family transcriptional regulator [Acidobacteriota bacterium]
MPSMKVTVPYILAEQTLVKLMRVGDQLWRLSDEWFAKWGLSDSHYNVLRILNGADGPIAQTEISNRLVSSRANVTKIIDLLEKKQFVTRLSCQDRRIKKVSLTKLGAKFLSDTQTEVIKFTKTLMQPLSEEELKLLYGLLEKLGKQ